MRRYVGVHHLLNDDISSHMINWRYGNLNSNWSIYNLDACHPQQFSYEAWYFLLDVKYSNAVSSIYFYLSSHIYISKFSCWCLLFLPLGTLYFQRTFVEFSKLKYIVTNIFDKNISLYKFSYFCLLTYLVQHSRTKSN